MDDERLKALMIAGLDGDRRAYQACLESMATLIRHSIARRMGHSPLGGDVEDVVQEILIAVHERRDTYDRSRPLMPWVYGIARYKWLMHYRSNKMLRSHVPFDEEVDSEIVSSSTSLQEPVGHDLRVLLDTLPASHRELLTMTKLQGLSVAEAAARTGVSEGAIKVRVHRAMATLRRLAGAK